MGNGRGKIINNGQVLTLSLNKASGSGFQSRNKYLFGKIDMQLKLIHGDSAETVTTYYLSSKESTWDEIDSEFHGNLSGNPYILHTNVFRQEKGNIEQQFIQQQIFILIQSSRIRNASFSLWMVHPSENLKT
ncbi:hypothetical protein HRI_001780700 [Hibiscus trionum]|uniref:GH16 domain-containing protein n=1 Tax=Hibiscus trionum TaxID=183268 RepID=A0A9W7HPC8_HIBTR|nr:hypothetical protein HRI_001780700 [Hibiscus trionum]